MVQFYRIGQEDTIFGTFAKQCQDILTLSVIYKNFAKANLGEKTMATPVIIGLAMIVAGLGLAGWIAYTVLHQRKEERRRSED
jgi:hypothetical protein